MSAVFWFQSWYSKLEVSPIRKSHLLVFSLGATCARADWSDLLGKSRRRTPRADPSFNQVENGVRHSRFRASGTWRWLWWTPNPQHRCQRGENIQGAEHNGTESSSQASSSQYRGLQSSQWLNLESIYYTAKVDIRSATHTLACKNIQGDSESALWAPATSHCSVSIPRKLW